MAAWVCGIFFVFAIVVPSHGVTDDFTKLKQRLELLEAKVIEQQGTIDILAERLDEPCDSQPSTGHVARDKRQISEGPVAFTATIRPTTVDHVHTDQKIIFETVVTNIGGGYDNTTGFFVAPLTGIYMFSCSLLDATKSGHGSQKLHAQILKNGNLLVKVFAHSESTNYRDQGSNTVFVHANKGDRFWVNNIDNNNLSLGGEYFSSFSGSMLWQL